MDIITKSGRLCKEEFSRHYGMIWQGHLHYTDISISQVELVLKNRFPNASVYNLSRLDTFNVAIQFYDDADEAEFIVSQDGIIVTLS